MAVKKIKKIVVFGASGKTGHQLVRYALEKGYDVTAFVRDKSKLALKYSNLRVVRGDVKNPKDVEKAVAGQDAVMSAIGVKPGQTPVCCEGIRNILSAMSKAKVSRLVAVSAHGARGSVKGFYAKILNRFLKEIMDDKGCMEELILKSRLAWTIVRPVLMTNGGRAATVHAEETDDLRGIRFISREDTARFMIDSMEGREYLKKVITIYR